MYEFVVMEEGGRERGGGSLHAALGILVAPSSHFVDHLGPIWFGLEVLVEDEGHEQVDLAVLSPLISGSPRHLDWQTCGMM